MKLLLVGMDGCHRDVFNRGWTPFISQHIQSYKHLEITTDLLSRGWLEIALGQHGRLTNALYDRPKANGTYQWTKKFSIQDIPTQPEPVVPIWQRLNNMGISVGIMNVPTTFPAPEVNGFFVSGGGGGAPVTSDASPELCYPAGITDYLNEIDYIVDDRLYELVAQKGLSTPAKIFERLSYKNERKTQAFTDLCQQYIVDFGLVIYKTPSSLAESFFFAERSRAQNAANSPDDVTIDAIKTYYQHFDAEIQKLAEGFPDAEIVFISDHGMTARTHSVNPNILLQKAGFQTADQSRTTLSQAVIGLKTIIPFWLKAKLKKSVAMKAKDVGQIRFSPKMTKAFCVCIENWTHGIFLNDVKRFGGPVLESEKLELAREIVELINSDPTAIQHGINAVIPPTNSVPQYPDIQLHVPDGYLTVDRTTEFVSQFSAPKVETALASIMRGDIFYIKSRNALAYASETIYDTLPTNMRKGDLTKVYDLVVNFFSNSRKE